VEARTAAAERNAKFLIGYSINNVVELIETGNYVPLPRHTSPSCDFDTARYPGNSAGDVAKLSVATSAVTSCDQPR
jgi:hypothetical protein